jgi:S-methylmethionine-dependent homocysteine/selenocysteine methylase
VKSKYRAALPQLAGGSFLGYEGMATDLIFNHGIDSSDLLAEFTLLESAEGQERFYGYCRDLIALGNKYNHGVILESPTWSGNRDRGAQIGYSPEQLSELNRLGIDMVSQAREEFGDMPTVLSCSVGPRDDAYKPKAFMSSSEAEDYHSEQINWVVDTKVDMVNAITLCYPEEAIGIANSTRKVGLPCVIGFTVETDGRLPNGESLEVAINKVDNATNGSTSYFIINCAHPDHFTNVLVDADWMQRLKGVIVNASRCSHAELDGTEELDDGDPVELGNQIADIHKKFPQISVLGGCCGTDFRHLEKIAELCR